VLPDVDLLDPDVFSRGEHHEVFRRLRAEDALYWHPDPAGPGFWCITKHADMQTVNRDAQTFSSLAGGIRLDTTQGSDGLLIDMDPPGHTRYRLLVNRGFTPRMVGLLEDALRARAERIVDRVIEHGEADLVVDIASELPLQAIAELLGVPQEDRHQLFEWSNRIIGFDDPEYAEESALAAAEMWTYIDRLALDRKAAPRDDIPSRLLEAEIDGEHLSEQEFNSLVLLLAVAGSETTRNATTHGVHALVTNPDQLALLCDDLDARLPVAVEEILRWESPVHHFRRTATVDSELRGKTIRAGDRVVLWHPSANRDEDVFENADRFDITRHPNPHVTFGGGGPHFCLGANLARLELKVILAEVLTRLNDLRLAGPLVPLRSNHLNGVKHLAVTWTPGPRKYAA
jgi:cholest-4-en-3-one 26-monooxygenase